MNELNSILPKQFKKVIIELENGEYIMGDTSRSPDEVMRSFDVFKEINEFNTNAKFDVQTLKDLFLEFLDSLK